MKKKALLLALTFAAAAGICSAWAAEPSHSYMDSLVRAGEPMEMKDGRRHPVDNPKLVPSQTAPVHREFRGHGPAVMPQDKKDAPKDAPKYAPKDAPKDAPKFEEPRDRKAPPKIEKKYHRKAPPKIEKRDRKAPPKFEEKRERKAPPHHRDGRRGGAPHRQAPPHHR